MKKDHIPLFRFYLKRDFFYLWEIVYLWFDKEPDKNELIKSPAPSIKALSQSIISCLPAMNKTDEYIYYINNPKVGNKGTIEKASAWWQLIFARDDLVEFANQRKQKPPVLFPDARNDLEGYLALKEAYDLNEDQQKKTNSKPKLNPRKTKAMIKERRLLSLKDFVSCVRRAKGESGLPDKPYYFPCKIEIIHDALKEWESHRVKAKTLNKSERVWSIKLSSFDGDFWKNNSERKAICKGIDPGYKSKVDFFEKLKIYNHL